ncbi:neurogenic locus notch homolog protein 1-like [Plakobranchus ocellatus]|uniref:Neurogenic locus notch homolog protein 1-like n=1 Tax=Plakobranchus ocellatus TaxID=259542 RepID=A0AAV3XUH1_9GAST|nr:neurogenic locus notch homolog protein 1-like [Plakobranchus ocellatus]
MHIWYLCFCLVWITNLLGSSLATNNTTSSRKLSSCSNGGTYYIDKQSIGRCLCAAGFVGLTCDEKDACLTNPCRNHGTCKHTSQLNAFANNSGSASCLCLPGFTGDSCEDEILPCEAKPCATGLCKNNGSSHFCQCPHGFSGSMCHIPESLCASAPCNANDGLAVCTETSPGYRCSCSKDNSYGLNCESKALPLPASGCDAEGEPESYCLCTADGRSVKVPLYRPRPDVGAKSRDFLAGFLGLVLGWLLGTGLLILYHQCFYTGDSVLARHARVEPIRQYSISSARSQSTTLSHYMHPEFPPTQPAQTPPPFPDTLTAPSATTTGSPPAQQQPDLHKNSIPNTAIPSKASETPRSTNIYRAGFVDAMAHHVARRKSSFTYRSAFRDW